RGLEWLADIVIRANTQPLKSVLEFALGRDKNDGHLIAIITQPLAEIEAAQMWQIHIKEYQIRRTFIQHSERAACRFGHINRIALFCEQKLNHAAAEGIIVNHQDAQ